MMRFSHDVHTPPPRVRCVDEPVSRVQTKDQFFFTRVKEKNVQLLIFCRYCTDTSLAKFS